MSMQRNSRYSYSKRSKKPKRNLFLYIRLFACLVIICAAFALKYADVPVVRQITQKVNEELKFDSAIEAISDSAKIGEDLIEVFSFGEKENAEKESEIAQPVFETDFYIDRNKHDDIKKEIEVSRQKYEEEEKQLSVETLSFYMSEEELADDTKAEVFKIPPPSYCSYEKANVDFKYCSPLKGIITSRFGYRDHPIIRDASFHTGLDIAAKKGSAIVAFADGKVIEAGRNSTYGNYLLIEHKNGIRSFYGHNSVLSVKKGERVNIGQKIAEVGSTGMSTGPHLHFEVRKNNIRIDPSLYISAEKV